MIITSLDLLTIIQLTQSQMLLAISADRTHCLLIFSSLSPKAPTVFLRAAPPSLSSPACNNARVSLPRGRTWHLSLLSFIHLITAHSSSLSVQAHMCRPSTSLVDSMYGEWSINHNLLSLIIQPVYCLSDCLPTKSVMYSLWHKDVVGSSVKSLAKTEAKDIAHSPLFYEPGHFIT